MSDGEGNAPDHRLGGRWTVRLEGLEPCTGSDRHSLSMPGRIRALMALVGAASIGIAFVVSGVSQFGLYAVVAVVGIGLSLGYSVTVDAGTLIVRRFGIAKQIPLASISRVERYRYGNVPHLRLRDRSGKRVASISAHFITDAAAEHLRRWLRRPDVSWDPSAWLLVAPPQVAETAALGPESTPSALGPGGPTRSVGLVSWKVSTLALYAFAGLAVLCLLADVAIWALTFASPTVVMPDWIFAPFFAFAIIGNIVTVLLITHGHGPKSIQDLLHFRHPPIWFVGAAALVGVVFFLSGPAQLFRNLPGQPGYNASTNQYYFDDHGSVIPTTRANYLSGVATQTRGFVSIATIFTGVMVFIVLAELARRRAVAAPRLSEIPRNRRPPGRLCFPLGVGFALVLGGLVLAVVSFVHIVQRVDSYLSNVPTVNTEGITEHLESGPWVVFVWCETHATEPSYGCAPMEPSDIVIRNVATGATIQTAPDPSSDHISPNDLPAAGQLTFTVGEPGNYSLVLTRAVPKGVFVAPSPGSIAWSLAPAIVLAILGVIVLSGGIVLLVVRVLWLVRDAPLVSVPA